MIEPLIHQPSFAASANTTSSLISRRQFLKCLGLGGVGLLTSVVAHQVTKNFSQNPPLRLIKSNNNLASRIIKYMVAKNYQVFTELKEYNIVYVEGMNEDGSLNKNTPNQFNDRRIVIEVIDGVPKIVGNWEATTEPGDYYTYHPMNPGGATRIKFGQYKAWAVGYHGNADRHEALIQVAPVTVYRDFNKDFQRTGDKLDTGLFNVSQSWGYDAPSKNIKNASAGSLVGRRRDGHREFMALIKQDRRYVANKDYVFYTTIIPGDDLVKMFPG
ncbi:peptidoglycan-binding protein [Tolypothrix sp. PCC 7910]|uniref:peptidoglycan-binding protein n=1 Tax=Tolypothrix sp. PCC 7910 TaxID=2099387 RepID=UPI001FCCA8EA|nr:peptidoglycan-binding protein [Tolypothrix sp. PCC 7910]